MCECLWVLPYPTPMEWAVVTWPPDLFPHNTEPHNVSTTVQSGVLTARQATFSVLIEQSLKPYPTYPHLSGRQAAPMHQRGLKTLRGLWTCSTCLVAAEGATFVGSGNRRSWRCFVLFCYAFAVSAYFQKLMWWIGFCGCYVGIFNFSQSSLKKPLHQSLCYFSI